MRRRRLRGPSATSVPTGTACSVYQGQSCSVSNACGAISSGVIDCNGVCTASAPALPANYGKSCTSSANSCGMTTAGTYDCSGACVSNSTTIVSTNTLTPSKNYLGTYDDFRGGGANGQSTQTALNMICQLAGQTTGTGNYACAANSSPTVCALIDPNDGLCIQYQPLRYTAESRHNGNWGYYVQGQGWCQDGGVQWAECNSSTPVQTPPDSLCSTTPKPITTTLAPAVSARISPNSIASGGSFTTLSYSSLNTSYCDEYVNNALVWQNAPTTYTWSNVGPYYADQKWTFVCYNGAGASAQDSVTLKVSAAGCQNGATNPPDCTLGGGCTNGATNPPACTLGTGGGCTNGATNPPDCTLGTGGGCVNGATNPPDCTIGTGGGCVNGATNPPDCTIGTGGGCVNGATNPPACTVAGPACPGQGKACTQTNSCGMQNVGLIQCSGTADVCPVGAPPDSTCPAPSISMTAAPGLVNPGSTCTVNWTVTNATGCLLSSDTADPSLPRSASLPNGSYTSVPLQKQATFTLTCKNGVEVVGQRSAICKINPTFKEI